MGETKEVGAAVGGESGAGGGEGKDGDMSFVGELDHKVGLHRSGWPQNCFNFIVLYQVNSYSIQGYFQKRIEMSQF